MTERELRQYVVDTAKSYYGCKESNGSHKKIIDIYNSHNPLARGYKVKCKANGDNVNDAWCATFVSAIAIKCGLTSIIPTECGCNPMIDLFKKLDTWVEADNHKPNIGDIIFYDWDDSGKGDNVGSADHVGIVVGVDSKTIKIIEGNMDNAVGYRTINLDNKYIRGFGAPKYALKASQQSADFSDVNPEAWYADAVNYCVEHGLMIGVGGGVFNPNEPVTRAQLATVAARLHNALINKI